MHNIYVTVACQSQLWFRNTCMYIVDVIGDCGEVTFTLLATFILLPLDPNANPNKRQRQPALLGDHPPDYGKHPFRKGPFT